MAVAHPPHAQNLHCCLLASWLQLNTVLQSLIDITKEGVVVDPDALYAAFRLDGGERVGGVLTACT
jgi:hypothetical protein